jgi:hypothetical protein
MKQFYYKEIMILNISVDKLLTVASEMLKLTSLLAYRTSEIKIENKIFQLINK